MGMAASQARFLSLTARKSNVEYEGQQVNQQRTALSNESANLYNKLMALDTPTPPNTSDYYSAVYTFTSTDLDKTSSKGSTEYEFSNIYSTPNGSFVDLSYTTYQWQSASTSAYRGDILPVTDNDNNITGYNLFMPNGSTVKASKLEYKPNEVTLDLPLIPDGKIHELTGFDGYSFQLNEVGTNVQISKEDKNGKTCKASYLVKDLGDGKYQLTLKVEKNSADDTSKPNDDYCFELISGVGNKYFVSDSSGDGSYSVAESYQPDKNPLASFNSQVLGTYYSENGNPNNATGYLTEQNENFFNLMSDDDASAVGLYNQPILAYNIDDTIYYISAQEFKNGYFQGSSYVHEVGIPTEATYPCIFTTAPNGRYKSIMITDENDVVHEFPLSVENRQDEQKYDQAMLDYQYEKSKYEKEVANINAKTEKIQAQDRTLELRLKQLDTEQNAISTEMDAVKKVIEDNVEATFKTFA